MDDYAYEIHIPDAKLGWVIGDASQTVKAYDESEAQAKANNFANNNYSNWRVRNVRLIKKYINPDGEI